MPIPDPRGGLGGGEPGNPQRPARLRAHRCPLVSARGLHQRDLVISEFEYCVHLFVSCHLRPLLLLFAVSVGINRANRQIPMRLDKLPAPILISL